MLKLTKTLTLDSQISKYKSVDCHSVLTNQILDDFVSVLKDWQIVFQQYPFSIHSSGDASYA